jgi:FG-GAP-like repeat
MRNTSTLAAAATSSFPGVFVFVWVLGAACSKDEKAEEAPTIDAAVSFAQGPGSPLAIGEAVARPLLVDINGDAKLDIVVSYSERTGNTDNPWAGAITVLLGDGNGGFRIVEPRIRHPLGGLHVAIGDIDSDGKPDLAFGAHDSSDVTLLRGDGIGQFGAPTIVPTGNSGSPHTHSVVLADLDADGKLDLIVGQSDHGKVAVFRGDGKAGFTAVEGSPFAAGNHPYEGLVACDLDRDGDLDVAVPDLMGGALTILLGDGTGRLVHDTSPARTTGPRPGFLTVGDLDGHGATDIAVTHDDDALLYVFWSDADDVGVRSTSLPLVRTHWGAVCADFDGDRRNDLALGDHQANVTILFGGGSTFAERRLRVAVGGRAPGYIAAGDVNGDGVVDLVTGNYETGDVSVLLAKRK